MSEKNTLDNSPEELNKEKMNTEQFELFKKAPARSALQENLDLKTLVGSMIKSIEEVNKVLLRVSKFSKTPALDAFSQKLNDYMQSLSTVIEPENKPTESPSSNTPK